jgi:hypothetical protein
MNRLRSLAFGLILIVVPAVPVWSWSQRGHALIRTWAVSRLPAEQKEWIGRPHLARLCREYIAIQDQFDGEGRREFAKYCTVPGVTVLLHDVNPIGPSVEAMQWYLRRISEELRAGRHDEAMRFLGVLCHWNEDPACPSAHSSPVAEAPLRLLIPPPANKQNLNYLYGDGGIADVGKYSIPKEEYRPRLLGASVPESAGRIYQHQRLLHQQAAAHIVPIVQDMMYGDGQKADQERARAALRNARHTADVIYTTLCLARNRIPPSEVAAWKTQRLTDWRPSFQGSPAPRPYNIVPFLINQGMDAERRLHPLALHGRGPHARVRFGFGTGAPFDLGYEIAPGEMFDTFTCRVGLHPAAGPKGRVVFVVLVNGEQSFLSDPISSGQQPAPVRVSLPGVEIVRLTLRTVPADDSRATNNLAVWAEPTLHRRELRASHRL